MESKIIEIKQPFYGKYKDNSIVIFDYLGRKCEAIITTNMLKFNKREFVNVGDSIDVLKSFKNNKVCYIVRKIY